MAPLILESARIDGAGELRVFWTIVLPLSYQLRLALTVVTIGPIPLAYPFAQRSFVKGLTLGATKG